LNFSRYLKRAGIWPVLLLLLLLFSFVLTACGGDATTLPGEASPGTTPSTTLTPGSTASGDATATPGPTGGTQGAVVPGVPTTAAAPSNQTSGLAPAPTQALPPPPGVSPDSLYVGETGHFIKAPFLAYWQKLGGYPVFGNPVSEAYTQDGLQVQLFDQALLEYHPDQVGQPGEITLGFLGRDLAQAQKLIGSNPAFAPVAKPANTTEEFIPETGHTLAEPFKSFWFGNGLVKFLGYPISQAFDQDGLSVQYFERGRLEANPTTKAVNYSNSGDLLVAAAGWPAPQKFDLRLNLPPSLAINQGQTLLVQLSNSAGWSPTDLQGKFGPTTLKFASLKLAGADAPVLRAYQAMDPALDARSYPLTLTFTDKNGLSRALIRSVQVNAKDFGTQDLALEGSLDALADHQADAYDDTQLAGAYNIFTPKLLWQGAWNYPLDVPWTLTTNFAQRRTYNGKLDTLYFHGGLDMAPDSGTGGANIHVAASGTVVYTGLLQARGNTVAVDHGMGITSYYFHMSAVDVKVGQQLQAGDVVGQVGSTGRSTGAHLHWEVRVNGIITDPRNFINTDFSK
jgi:murein DD-endopeptidase MepM/ murein hydrolase activator NlpD